MALADSVPGVSGGTIAFLMGFYDNFIGSLNALISGSKQERIQAVKYLIKLGIGWVIGFCSSVLVLANVFESHIYRVSSLFIGFIIFAIPVVIYEEKKVLKDRWKMSFFVLIGMAFVVAITYANTFVGGGKDLSNPDIGMYIYAFFVGAAARKQLGFDDGMCILSFGGSLGAGCINEAMAKVIPWHVQKGLSINHIHGYGGMGKETFPKAMAAAGIPLKGDRLRITEYINDMDVCLAAADLVICRSGASTLAELEAAGRGSILIPSPIVTGNHQLHNANVLGDAGAAVVIEQKDASPERIIAEVEQLYADRERLTEMGHKAKSLEIADTDNRIWNVVAQLYQKAKSK